jgi:hypothetical protein
MDNSIISNLRTRNFDFMLWLMWVIASTAAVWVSFGVLFGLIIIATSIFPNINEDRMFGYIMFPVTAAILGVFQWLILRKWIPRSGWWILATIIGLVGGITLVGGADQALSHITGQAWIGDLRPGLLTEYLLIGLLLALAQLPILWRHFRGTIIWLLSSMIGWLVLGLIVGESIDRTSDIFAVGVIPALFTGFALIWLIRKPHLEPEHTP